MLCEIFDKHGCDKGSSKHRYDRVYEAIFAPMRQEPIRLLEIGILGGASLAAWVEYFPNGTIIGVDTFERVPAQDVSILKHSRVQWYRMDSTKDRPDIEPVDFVIDDGHHEPDRQLQTFRNYFPLTDVYFIEDSPPMNTASYRKLRAELCGYRVKEHHFNVGRGSCILEVRR